VNEDFDRYLEAEWAGELDAAGRARLDALCAADPALAERRRRESELTALLARQGPNHAPGGLARAVFARIDAEAAAGSRAAAGGWRGWLRGLASPWWRAPQLRWGMAFALVMVAVVEVAVILRGGRGEAPMVAMRSPETDAGADTAAAPGISASRQQELMELASQVRVNTLHETPAGPPAAIQAEQTRPAPAEPVDATAIAAAPAKPADEPTITAEEPAATLAAAETRQAEAPEADRVTVAASESASPAEPEPESIESVPAVPAPGEEPAPATERAVARADAAPGEPEAAESATPESALAFAAERSEEPARAPVARADRAADARDADAPVAAEEPRMTIRIRLADAAPTETERAEPRDERWTNFLTQLPRDGAEALRTERRQGFAPRPTAPASRRPTARQQVRLDDLALGVAEAGGEIVAPPQAVRGRDGVWRVMARMTPQEMEDFQQWLRRRGIERSSDALEKTARGGRSVYEIVEDGAPVRAVAADELDDRPSTPAGTEGERRARSNRRMVLVLVESLKANGE